MSRLTAFSLLLIALIGSSQAVASEQSKQLTARGLMELNAERLEQARDLLDQAVAADPNDSYALYYRGVIRARLRNYEAAIEDFEIVLAARPDLEDATLDLGIALLETGNYEDASRRLEQAQTVERLAARASLFLGVAQLRLGEVDAARENFRRAAADSKERLAARYYLGVVEHQASNWPGAKEHFTYVVDTSPDSVMGSEATAFLAAIQLRERRGYQVYGGIGFQYDSNVVLAPSQGSAMAEQILGVSGQADGSAVFTAGGIFVPWSNDNAAFSVAYDFYQSVHFDLSEFDLQDHGPSVQLAGNIGSVRLGLLSRYDYYLLQTDSFLQQATAFPWVSIPSGEFGQTDLFYEMSWREYKQLDFRITNAFHHTLGIRQMFFLGSKDRYATLGYQFERVDPVIDNDLVKDGVFTKAAAKALAYDGDQFEVAFVSPLPADVEAELVYAFRHERYLPQSAMFSGADNTPGHRRRDNEHVLILGARRPLMDHLDLVAAFLADWNGSKDPDFEYDRYIVSMNLEARF